MSDRHLRIEMLLPSLPRAGMEVVAARLAFRLRDRGHEVGFTCIAGPGELGEELRAADFRVSVVPAPGLTPNLIARELGPWFDQQRPDVVHVHNGVWLKAVQGARYARVPLVVYTLHGIDLVEPWYMRYINRHAARHTAHVVAVSETLRTYLRDVVHVPTDRITVIPNGVSTRKFQPGSPSAPERAALGLPPDTRPIIGIVARLDPVKNHALLIDAFARVRRERPDAYLLLVGDGDCRGQLEAQIAGLGLTDHVRITGVLPDSAPFLAQMDLFVLASDIEGTSMSLLEAMAAALPIVATDVGGTPALLRHGECGLLVPPRNTASLADTLLYLLRNPQVASDLGRKARSVVENFHSEERMTDRYEQVYAASRAAGLLVSVPN